MFRDLLLKTAENHQASWSPGGDLNPGPDNSINHSTVMFSAISLS
jgi:hypothetical protein